MRHTLFDLHRSAICCGGTSHPHCACVVQANCLSCALPPPAANLQRCSSLFTAHASRHLTPRPINVMAPPAVTLQPRSSRDAAAAAAAAANDVSFPRWFLPSSWLYAALILELFSGPLSHSPRHSPNVAVKQSSPQSCSSWRQFGGAQIKTARTWERWEFSGGMLGTVMKNLIVNVIFHTLSQQADCSTLKRGLRLVVPKERLQRHM